jgi:tRNA(adenine34) deaminase
MAHRRISSTTKGSPHVIANMTLRPERYRNSIVPHTYVDGASAAIAFYTRAVTGVHAMAKKRPQRRWVRRVKTDSTHPPPRTFAGSASQIARTMARKDVSPKGLGSAIRMIQYFINRGGRRLSASRRRELERAKRILQQRRQSAG